MTDTPDTQQQDEQPDTGQAARWTRREPLLVLLSRMQRGVLTAAERPLLRAAVETELADGDQAHRKVADYENRITWETTCGEHASLLDSCRRAEERAEKAEDKLARVRRVAGWAANGWSDLTPEKVLAVLDDDQPAEAQPESHSCGNCEGIDPEDCLNNPNRAAVVREQPAGPDVGAVRDAVAEAIMCGDGPCIARCHLPRIERLLGGVGLLLGEQQ